MRLLLLSVLLTLVLFQPAFSADKKQITPETALQAYLHNADTSFKWELKEKQKGEGMTFYRFEFTSQTWQTIRWTHDLMLMVPDELKYDDALLFITGGSNKNGKPNSHKFNDELPLEFSRMCKVKQINHSGYLAGSESTFVQ